MFHCLELHVSKKYFLSGKENLCIIFILLNVSGSINCHMQLHTIFSHLALLKDKPAVL